MSTSFILKHLTERRASMAQNAIDILEAGVAAGEIKNALYLDAKDTVNRAMEEAAEAFLATGPHKQKHNQSDWWLAAYEAEAFLHGAHYLPAALKRAQKAAGLKEYAAFLAALSPLAELLAAAKPLIVKRQTGPQAPKTAKQIEREAATMTCQCCARKYLANLGTIAHHGYERPGFGWQTASCMGAKWRPFEVDRGRLGDLIRILEEQRTRMRQSRAEAKAEKFPITRSYEKRNPENWRKPIKVEVKLTRSNFEAEQKAHPDLRLYVADFDALKAADLSFRDSQIASISGEIARQIKRYETWVKTHDWHAATQTWKLERIKA